MAYEVLKERSVEELKGAITTLRTRAAQSNVGGLMYGR
jgi:hypothetical protein